MTDAPADDGVGDELRSALEHVTHHPRTEPMVTAMSIEQQALDTITSMLHRFELGATRDDAAAMQETWHLELDLFDPTASPETKTLVGQLLMLTMTLGTQLAVAMTHLNRPPAAVTPAEVIAPALQILRSIAD